MLCVVPALRSLRAGLPDASIALVGLPWARAFVRRFHRYVDELIEFPGHPAMPEQPARPELWPDFVAAMRARRFDLALQLHGSGETSNAVVAELGAARCAGFFPGPDPAPDPVLPTAPDPVLLTSPDPVPFTSPDPVPFTSPDLVPFTSPDPVPFTSPDPATFLAWEPREHEVLRYLRLMRHLRLPDRGSELEWPALPEDDRDEAVVALHHENYVCVHPGARLPSRRWPLDRFAEVADRLAASGYAVVVTGSAEEAALTAEVTGRMRERALDLAGKTSLGSLARLIERARLLVCNDTGVSHVAAAVGTPSVVVCCGADPLRWAPLDQARHRVLHVPLECRPCMHRVCPIGHTCALGITPAQVVDEAWRLLRSRVRSGTGEEVLQ